MAADALGTPAPAATPTVGVVSDEDHRLAMAGMIAPQSSTLAVRSGVVWGPGTTALVTGTAATGTMTVGIAIHHAVTTRGTADGVYLGPTLDAATTVNIAAAPASNSRIDVVYVKQNDTASSISPDSGSTQPLYGVVTGTAAVSPTKPSLPVGAEELATVTVAAGATSTNGAGVTIANTARQTVARGARIPVRNQTERDALTAFAGLEVYRLDTGAVEQRNAANSAWVTVYDPAATGQWVIVYQGADTYTHVATGTGTTLTGCSGSVTVPTGRTLEVDLQIPRLDVPTSGGVYIRLMINGTIVRSVAVQTGSTTSLAAPAYLHATASGAGSSMTFTANVYGAGAAGTVRGIGDGTAAGGPLFRYRII